MISYLCKLLTYDIILNAAVPAVTPPPAVPPIPTLPILDNMEASIKLIDTLAASIDKQNEIKDRQLQFEIHKLKYLHPNFKLSNDSYKILYIPGHLCKSFSLD